jgi:hypothetical protein
MYMLYGCLFLALVFRLVHIIDYENDIDNSCFGFNRLWAELFLAFIFDCNKLLLAFVAFFFPFLQLFNINLLDILVF